MKTFGDTESMLEIAKAIRDRKTAIEEGIGRYYGLVDNKTALNDQMRQTIETIKGRC